MDGWRNTGRNRAASGAPHRERPETERRGIDSWTAGLGSLWLIAASTSNTADAEKRMQVLIKVRK